ncbi:helix-turn-helix transcriptional regulator [Microbacterium murale]|uniref:AraC-like DNA-binding protein n=1 Tax=Microbacterium murale TaxID=1081040 RepID=A0ABU0P727_9MICO|nr:AraC family transcriptional regulator [Microbacterium murale]MDQ0643144.1 AraC-like DNA-binding protein [Microbacterium murale]
MATIDQATLERVLSGVNVFSGGTRRVELPSSGALPLADGVVSFVHVVAGAVRGHPPLASGCTLGIDRATQTISVTQPSTPGELAAGGALLTLGDRSVILDAPNGAILAVGELELTDPSALQMMPDFVVVNDFAALEPAAAALAAQQGTPPFAATDARSGDPLICRMMATTVLLSVIRAWAEKGCAPDGWAARSSDPFLDRVIAAIHRTPGREWTVESLASVGAMSRSVFAERFRAVVGQSPASYVTDVRMDAAKSMLAAGNTVSGTARELGYSSDEGFSRAFRRATGVTPSRWRTSERTPIPA